MKTLSVIWLVTSGLVLQANIGQAQCPGNLFVNGSFTGPEGSTTAPPGWNATYTPDVNDANGPLNCQTGYTWIGTPIPSADGGTWVNLSEYDMVEQIIATIPGKKYLVQFEYASQPITAHTGAEAISVFVDESAYNPLTYIGLPDYSPYTWEQASFVFTAINTQTAVWFSGQNDQYIAIDGVCATEAPSPSDPKPNQETILLMPNIFTPNGDGMNDYFVPQEMENIQQANLTIYNRWGVAIQEIKDLNQGWNGTHNQQNCTDGTYFWVITYQGPDQKTKTEKGFVTLTR